MTTYGTIDPPSPISTNLDFLSQVKTRLQTGLNSRSPWKEMFELSSFSIPISLTESITRIQSNIAIFQINYVIIVLFILFLSLFWQPLSLIILAVMMIICSYLYFLREDPIVLLGRVVDNRVVATVLFLATIVVLFSTGAIDNVVIGLLIGVVVVLLHAVLRDTVDLLMDDVESAGSSGVLPPSTIVQLKDTASDSYSFS